jgi:hypothetical protein
VPCHGMEKISALPLGISRCLWGGSFLLSFMISNQFIHFWKQGNGYAPYFRGFSLLSSSILTCTAVGKTFKIFFC